MVKGPPTTPKSQEQIAARPEEKIALRKEVAVDPPVEELKKEKSIVQRPVVDEANRRGEEKRPQVKVVEATKKNKVDARVGGPEVTLRTAAAAGRVVNLRNVSSTEAGDVSGEVVNNSKQTLRDVRLQILYSWRWTNEYEPGKDDPGKAIYHVLDKEIPPGQTVRFHYQPSPPFASRDDGQFNIGVKIVGFAFFCTVPSEFVAGRRLQIDYLKRFAPDLACITWQPYQANLYQYQHFHTWLLPARIWRKAKRLLTRQQVIQRNWEVQFFQGNGRQQLHDQLLSSGLRIHEYLPATAIRSLLETFYQQPDGQMGYTVSMLLTFAAWLEQYG
jgi:hypothetical protein